MNKTIPKNKAKVNLPNILAFLQGYLRYPIYYSKFSYLIPKHIREQIDYRIKSMRGICFTGGACEECGCRTTHLQMANKPCPGPCYPKILNKKTWDIFKSTGYYKDLINKKIWQLSEGRFI